MPTPGRGRASVAGVIRVLARATGRDEVKQIGTKLDYFEMGSVIDWRGDCPNLQGLEQPLITDL